MILSRNIFALLAIFAAPLPLCLATPGWYEAYDGKRYLIEPDFKVCVIEKCFKTSMTYTWFQYNWLQAYDQCRRRGLQLVDVNSAVKNEVLISLLRSIFGKYKLLVLTWINCKAISMSVHTISNRTYFEINALVSNPISNN